MSNSYIKLLTPINSRSRETKPTKTVVLSVAVEAVIADLCQLTILDENLSQLRSDHGLVWSGAWLYI